MKLPKATEMQALDRIAIEQYGIPGIVLMENAGLGTVLMMEKELGSAQDTFSLILIGPGNNGGDGLVIGRHLHQRGCHVIFIFLVNPDQLKGDAAVNVRIIKELRIPYHVIDSEARVQTLPVLVKQFTSQGRRCYGIVDAIFGTGLSRGLEGHFADTITLVNQPDFSPGVPVVSVDIPSGVNSDNGRVLGVCIRADYTATYGLPQPGHILHDGPGICGKLHVVDIGIPPEAISGAGIHTELITRESLEEQFGVLKRATASHKGNHGHLLVLAGSTGKTGAAMLSSLGAQRCGVGLATLGVPADLNSIFESSMVEAMTAPLPSHGFLSIEDIVDIETLLDLKQCLVIGPGLGLHEYTAELVIYLYHKISQPMVIDADALNILAAHLDRLKEPGGPRIFTPHPGELSRLLRTTVSKIQANRAESVEAGCKLFENNDQPCTMVLKGAGTLVASSDGMTFINTTGNPGMASGGMGDVLSGVIGGLICQGLSPLDASVLGVYIHGDAGDMLFEKNGIGYFASELADTLPLSMKKLCCHSPVSNLKSVTD
ncbi:MAG: NAD(P)H-hydrate dehydratase [Thermodesulfobacteriota bacterium]